MKSPKTNKPRRKPSPDETYNIVLASTDQDNFDDAMPRELLEDFIRDQGGDPEALWKVLGPFIEEKLMARAKRTMGG
jgi:hypothetical protein